LRPRQEDGQGVLVSGEICCWLVLAWHYGGGFVEEYVSVCRTDMGKLLAALACS
jgi:hypothetical protein